LSFFSLARCSIFIILKRKNNKSFLNPPEK
jgi:hypothetical protein